MFIVFLFKKDVVTYQKFLLEVQNEYLMTVDSYVDSQEKLMTINLLQIAFKRFETLGRLKNYLLEKGVEISVANLSRYINGKALPKSKLKEKLLSVLIQNKELGLTIPTLINKRITIISNDSENISVNNSHLLNDSKSLTTILFIALREGIISRDVDKVITAEVDGIPIGMILGQLLNVDCVYARKKKLVGTTKVHYEDVHSHGSGRMDTLYLPDKFIRSGEKVILVDDVIRSGSTQRALISLVRRSGGTPNQILTLIGIGDHWKEITTLDSIPFKSLIIL